MLQPCDRVGPALADAAVGAIELDRAQQRHVETCLRCQAEMVQYRKLLRALRALRIEVIEPSPGWLAELLAAVGEAGEHWALREALRGRRVAYLGGLAAATAAAAGGAIVLRSRRRLKIAS